METVWRSGSSYVERQTMQLEGNVIGNNTQIKAFQETFGEEVEDEGEESYNTRSQEELELAHPKRKVKLE